MTDSQRTHIDGTPCLEGTSSLPSRFAACCDEFNNHTLACTFDIRYEWWTKQRQWVIAIDGSAGGGGICISHCPHCGAQLEPKSRARSGRMMQV